jgi:hypothetical protein
MGPVARETHMTVASPHVRVASFYIAVRDSKTVKTGSVSIYSSKKPPKFKF